VENIVDYFGANMFAALVMFQALLSEFHVPAWVNMTTLTIKLAVGLIES
jgi:hypothetical protein